MLHDYQYKGHVPSTVIQYAMGKIKVSGFTSHSTVRVILGQVILWNWCNISGLYAPKIILKYPNLLLVCKKILNFFSSN